VKQPVNGSTVRSSCAVDVDRLGLRLKRRPVAVTIIALVEFARAAMILVVAICMPLFPNANLAARTDVKVLTYVSAGQNLPSSVQAPIVLPLAAASLVVLGLGLWFLKKWARNLLMIGSGGVVVLWIRRFFSIRRSDILHFKPNCSAKLYTQSSFSTP
jgi:hypothetical protein